ncbi:cell wall-binding repeat-containing protein, partial [Agromyces luteolus]
FPDALSGAPVAGATGGPVLLTSSTAVPRVVIDELLRLKPGKVILLGGSTALSARVNDTIEELN